MRFLALLVFVSFYSLGVSAQHTDWKSIPFRSPVNIPIKLSGNFGEIRYNHFHSGIDIKTNNREGYSIYAIEEGYVSRIKVSPFGYGNALYVTHPNGFTSVYAHLQSFKGPVAKYINDIQHNREVFAVDLYPDDQRFWVEKGEVIALSGNSGGSFGPHLHFEIRKTDTEEPLNPLLFNFDVPDRVAPVMEFLTVYHPKTNKQLGKYNLVKSGQGRYAIKDNKTVLLPNNDTIAFGLYTYDNQIVGSNKNGIYTISLQEDLDTLYQFTMKQFSFDETRYINAHIDYDERKRSRKKVHKLYIQEGNRLRNYSENLGNGMITSSGAHQYEVVVTDANGNKATLSFTTKATQPKITPPSPKRIALKWNEPLQYESTDGQMKLNMPALSVYQDCSIDITNLGRRSENSLSNRYAIGDERIPVHHYFDIAISASALTTEEKRKAVIIRQEKDGDRNCEDGRLVDGFIKTSARSFGLFYIDIDDVAPKISSPNFGGGKLFTGKNITIKITDNLSGIDTYKGYIDGQWVLMQYDAKKRKLIHRLSNELTKGLHEFTLKVTDAVGNEANYKTSFKR